MNSSVGLVLAVLGGVLMGSFSLPMKKTAQWAWENTWLVWAVAALVITPWTIALITVPDLIDVYAKAGWGTLGMVFLFGVGWGLGAVTFGQSLSLLGMSLAFAISIGLTLALGALVPMARNPVVFVTPGGMTITAGVLLMLTGVVISAIAGRRKEAQMNRNAEQTPVASAAVGTPGSTSATIFVKGLTLAILSGFFNPMINFAFNFADRIKEVAAAAGASAGGASDAISVSYTHLTLPTIYSV